MHLYSVLEFGIGQSKPKQYLSVSVPAVLYSTVLFRPFFFSGSGDTPQMTRRGRPCRRPVRDITAGGTGGAGWDAKAGPAALGVDTPDVAHLVGQFWKLSFHGSGCWAGVNWGRARVLFAWLCAVQARSMTECGLGGSPPTGSTRSAHLMRHRRRPLKKKKNL